MVGCVMWFYVKMATKTRRGKVGAVGGISRRALSLETHLKSHT